MPLRHARLPSGPDGTTTHTRPLFVSISGAPQDWAKASRHRGDGSARAHAPRSGVRLVGPPPRIGSGQTAREPGTRASPRSAAERQCRRSAAAAAGCRAASDWRIATGRVHRSVSPGPYPRCGDGGALENAIRRASAPRRATKPDPRRAGPADRPPPESQSRQLDGGSSHSGRRRRPRRPAGCHPRRAAGASPGPPGWSTTGGRSDNGRRCQSLCRFRTCVAG